MRTLAAIGVMGAFVLSGTARADVSKEIAAAVHDPSRPARTTFFYTRPRIQTSP